MDIFCIQARNSGHAGLVPYSRHLLCMKVWPSESKVNLLPDWLTMNSTIVEVQAEQVVPAVASIIITPACL